jgi:hypothetical protein
MGLIAPLSRHGHLALSLHPRPVIARNEAIHRPTHNNMDCHGAARLAMTGGGPLHPCAAMATPAPSWPPRPFIAPPPCHCEERSNPSADAQQYRLPRRCAPRNDGRRAIAPLSRHGHPALSLHPRPVIAPPPRHCEERSNPSADAREQPLPMQACAAVKESTLGQAGHWCGPATGPAKGDATWESGSNWVCSFWCCCLVCGRSAMPNRPMPRPWPSARLARPPRLRLRRATETALQNCAQWAGRIRVNPHLSALVDIK